MYQVRSFSAWFTILAKRISLIYKQTEHCPWNTVYINETEWNWNRTKLMIIITESNQIILNRIKGLWIRIKSNLESESN